MASGSGASRIIALDALRGFAVMGILAMNIIAFSMPEMAYISPRIYGGENLADLIAWSLSFLLIDGKMRGLFSLLFGASMILIADRAAASGQSAVSVHYRRMAWLALFGLCHFLFLWWGDILFLYAAVGSVAFLMRGWSHQRLIRWAIGLYALGTLVMTILMGSSLVSIRIGESAGASSEQVELAQEMRAEYSLTDEEIDEEVAFYRSDYWTITADQFANVSDLLVGVAWSFLETLPLMMLGMALFRSGFLVGGRERAIYWRSVAAFLVPGFLLTLALLWVEWRTGFDPVIGVNIFAAWGMPARLMMTIGYAALLLLLIGRYAQSGWMMRVAAAGRAAFTNYLGTSLVMTFIFYGYGLGLFGAVPRAELYLFVLGAWALMLLWSKPWLDHFRYGPLEWLWRCLAQGKWVPLRRGNA
ncbi:DUF418 domain-containing protein [Sphingopyxis sp. MWB1]|uniref:DUF418 domain-containing protein n=1 Tax=Sphingopyxis sp. MWB1 TaxID=1537715 RepID=UPI00051A688C|nr:DUF418 domain-containing protein [Sphingopyxis sp. MWB1]